MSIKNKILLLLVIIPALCLSQEFGSLKGKVMDSKDSSELIGATILIKGDNTGASTGKDGTFQIKKTPAGKKLVSISMIGYKTKIMEVTIEKDITANLIVTLSEDQLKTDEVIITAGKREQSLKEIPVSVNIVDSKELFTRNIQTFDDAMRYVPGVNMTEYQINIRGSSGYSRGVGNRVLLLLDGLPLLSGDTGDMKFDVISICQIDKVEVVKGAGSTLYGSSALGGIVNIITKEPKEDLSLNAKIFSGMYDKPQYKDWEWSDGNRFYNGMDLNFSQKFGNLGIILSGGVKNNEGYRKEDDSHKRNIFFKAKYKFESGDLFTLSSSLARDKRGNYIVWEDVSDALKADPSMTWPGEKIISDKFFINSNYKHLFRDNSFLNIKTNYFRTHFEDNQIDTMNSTANVYNAEVQYVTSILKNDFLTCGIAGSYNLVTSPKSLYGERKGNTLAAYLQEEMPIYEYLKLTGGIRYDRTEITDGEVTESISPKAGITFEPFKGTSLRGSVGTGFRAPSIGEKYTNTTAGGIVIVPNPELKPENSISYEIGGSQVLSDFMILDIALFRNEYEDLIEPIVSSVTGKVSFQNITKASIQGFETGLKYQVLSGLVSGSISYTYMDPYDEIEKSILKFRSKHLLYINTDINYNHFAFGMDYRYISKIEKIDALLAKVIKSSQVRVPIHVVDFRAEYNFSNIKLLFNINNALNYNYVEVVGNLAPIRNFALTLEYNL
jgi:outer membrane receptor for ferrienterochelin and colicins